MVRLPEPPGREPEVEVESESVFEKLMRIYKASSDRARVLKEELKEIDGQLSNAKGLIKNEVNNLGLARGSNLKVAGIGKFHYTTQRYYSIPVERRAEFVALIIERGEEQLLEMGKKTLNDWCAAIEADHDPTIEGSFPLPDYIRFFEDTKVPVITPTKEVEE